MKQIRVGVFETNSSSTHSLTIVSEEDYEKWKSGELLLDYYNDVLVPIPDGYEERKEKDEFIDDEEELKSFDDWEDMEKESFISKYTSKSGDKIVIFGNYGYDG